MEYIYKHIIISSDLKLPELQKSLDSVPAQYRLLDAITLLDGDYTVLVFYGTVSAETKDDQLGAEAPPPFKRVEVKHIY